MRLSATEKGTVSATPPDSATAAVASPPTTDSRSSAVSTESDRELKDALWVEGRVIIPEGTPPDEHVEILAEGGKFKSRPLHRTPMAPDGSFRVAFAPGTEVGELTLEAHYLYLDTGMSISPSNPSKDIVLTPKIGGDIRGRLVPADGSSSLRMSLVGCKVRASAVPEFEQAQSVNSLGRVAKVS